MVLLSDGTCREICIGPNTYLLPNLRRRGMSTAIDPPANLESPAFGPSTAQQPSPLFFLDVLDLDQLLDPQYLARRWPGKGLEDRLM